VPYASDFFSVGKVTVSLLKWGRSSVYLIVMNSQESTLINELFDRISKNPLQQIDSEADRLIAEKISANPQAAYVLTQSTIILQQAVTAAQARISALEKQVAEASAPQQGGGFLSGVSNLFGAPQPPVRPVAPPPIPQQATPAPAAPSAGGSFLQNAAATAAGVAGGALLFQGIENLMGHGGGGFGGGGFGGGSGFMGQGQPTEVINNYYMDDQNSDAVAQADDDSSYDLADNDSSDSDGSDFFGGGDDLV